MMSLLMVRPEVRARLTVVPLLFASACAQGSLGVSPGTILSTIIVATGTTIPRTTPSGPRPGPSRRRIPESPAPTPTASRILHIADSYVGVPYTWGGNTPKEGFDCSGFTKYVFAKQGITLPRTSREQARVGTGIAPDFASLRPGDLMMFAEPGEAISHVAIYVGSGEIIHSSSSVGGVGYTDLNTGGEWFVQNLVAARRIR
jgi:cell wall-associated NlpC family hydrolase